MFYTQNLTAIDVNHFRGRATILYFNRIKIFGGIVFPYKHSIIESNGIWDLHR